MFINNYKIDKLMRILKPNTKFSRTKKQTIKTGKLMMNETFNITKSFFVVCEPRYIPPFSFIYVIPFFHMMLSITAPLYSFYKNKYFLYYAMFCSQMLNIVATSFQFFFKELRPFPECTPISYTSYSMPAPEIVSVTSFATCILIYSTIF